MSTITSFALPYCDYSPSRVGQSRQALLIPPNVGGDLRSPKALIRFGKLPAPFALMAVPETTVNEDRGTKTRKHYVRPTRQFVGMDPVTAREPELPQDCSNHSFRVRVLGPDTRHYPASLSRREYICHGITPTAARGISGEDRRRVSSTAWVQ